MLMFSGSFEDAHKVIWWKEFQHYFPVENYIMASGSENKIGDFDIDEVINWDDHTYASKGLEFGELPLGLEEHVSGTSQQVSQAAQPAHQDNLLLGNSVLPARSAIVTPREPRTSMVSQSSRISNLFSSSPNVMIQGNLLHAPRSRTFPAPAFPSENFDLPPITPPASAAPPSIFGSLDHQIVAVGTQGIPSNPIVTGNINTTTNIQANVPTFSQPNLSSPLPNIAVNQHLGHPVSEVMEERSIDKIIDEIVDRDMPQGVNAPIVFTQQVNQNLNTRSLTSGNIQQVSASLQQNVAPPRSSSPVQRPTHLDMNQHMKQSTSLAGTPLNINPLNQAPGSPHRPARTPSPQVAVGQNSQKISIASPVGQRQTGVQGAAMPLAQPTLSQIQTQSVTTQKISPEKLNSPHPMSPSPVHPVSSVQQIMNQEPKLAGQGSPLSSVSQQSSIISRNINNKVPLQPQQTKSVNVCIPQSQTRSVAQPVTPQNTSFPTAATQGVYSAGTQASKLQVPTSGGVPVQASMHLNTSAIAGNPKSASFANAIQAGVSSAVQPIKGSSPMQALQIQGKMPASGILTQAQAMQLVRAVAPNVSGQVVITQAPTSTGNKLLLYVMPQSTANTQLQTSAGSTAAGQKLKMIVINTSSPLANPQQKGTVSNTIAGQPTTVQTTMSVGQTRSMKVQQKSNALLNVQTTPVAVQKSTVPAKPPAAQQLAPSTGMGNINQNIVSGQHLNVLGLTGMQLSSATTNQIANLSVVKPSSTNVSNIKTNLPVSMLQSAQMVKQPVTNFAANGKFTTDSQIINSNPQDILPTLAHSKSTVSANQTSSTVQITFVNETTAISKVNIVSTPLSSSSWQSSSASLLFSSLNTTTSTQALTTPIVTATPASILSPVAVTSDEEDSTPLALLRKYANEESDDLMPLAHLKKSTNITDPEPTPSISDQQTKVEGKKKKKKTKKKKRDVEPVKPPSPYQIFLKETQTALRDQSTAVPFSDIAKTLTHMWDSLPEEQKKIYQNKHEEAMSEYKKALEQFKGKQKAGDSLGEPKAKQRKIEMTSETKLGILPDSTSLLEPTVESAENVGHTTLASTVTPLASGTKLSKNNQSTKLATARNITTTASGKPVATVSPMATVKKTSTESSTFSKPKKSKVTINPISQRLCIRDGCTMPARTTKERGTQFCSHECIVKHCRTVFKQWVSARRAEAR